MSKETGNKKSAIKYLKSDILSAFMLVVCMHLKINQDLVYTLRTHRRKNYVYAIKKIIQSIMYSWLYEDFDLRVSLICFSSIVTTEVRMVWFLYEIVEFNDFDNRNFNS